MMTETMLAEPAQVPRASSLVQRPSDHARSRRRFAISVTAALGVMSIPYLWIACDLWTGTWNPFRKFAPDNFYDLQARAMLAGHLYVPNGSLGIEAWVNHGRQYTYFGLFPSIIRIPILLLTHSLDSELTVSSMFFAWIVTGTFSSLLLWRVRTMTRGNVVLTRAEAAGCGVLVAAISGGSVLLYLVAFPKVSHEDLAWSVALTVASIFALIGMVERPSWGRFAAAGALVLCANLDRSPTAYACDIASVLIAGWFATGRGGTESRRWAAPMLCVGFGALAVSVIVNWLKLGQPFGFDESHQIWTQLNAHRRRYLAANGGGTFGFHFLPSTLLAYLQPAGIAFQSAFPWVTLPTEPARAVGNVVLDQTYPAASFPASMPLLFVLGVWGVIAAFRPGASRWLGVMRLLLLATAAATAAVLLFGYMADRYLADFLPFFILASVIGLVELWRYLDSRPRWVRSIALFLIFAIGIFSIWANVGAAITPSGQWTRTQAQNYVTFEKNVSGAGLDSMVRFGSTLPYFAPQGELYVVGSCRGLYVSSGFSYQTVPGEQLQHDTWIPVEQQASMHHTLTVEFNRAVNPSDGPVVLLRYGPSSLDLVPIGPDRVEMSLRTPGVPVPAWPPATASPVQVRPHVVYSYEVTTDPNLAAIDAEGQNESLQHYLPGSGPATVAVTGSTAGSGALATVTNTIRSSQPMTLCRSFLSKEAEPGRP